MSADISLEELVALAPWHYNLRLGPNLRTRDANTGEHASLTLANPHDLMSVVRRIYPAGLAGKRFLDVACNGGAYCLIARKLGAAQVLGFDVREHWIRQARFLKERLHADSGDALRFEVCDLMNLDSLLMPDQRFDICIFKGIFYHLPDPVAGLKRAADRTAETLIVDSDTAPDQPDGYLKLITEGSENPLSGVHHLAWLPTGPGTLVDILRWLGFAHTRTLFVHHPATYSLSLARGRVRIVATRHPDVLQAFDASAAVKHPASASGH